MASPIKNLRTELGMTLEQFHREFRRRTKGKVPLSFGTLYQYELGWKTPRKDIAKALCQAFPQLDRLQVEDYSRRKAVG